MFRKLAALGQGHWHRDRSVKRLFSDDEALRDQELWRCKTTRGGRIVFEVAADFDERSKTWKEMLRLWVSRVYFSPTLAWLHPAAEACSPLQSTTSFIPKLYDSIKSLHQDAAVIGKLRAAAHVAVLRFVCSSLLAPQKSNT